MQLPRISVVTPSYNQGQFIEETMQSVLDQGYPNLEYIVIDGGSTDNSVDVIRKYERHLAYWVSEKDSGAADAIAKGFSKATGEILAYLNSDDLYLPGSLQTVGTVMAEPAIDVAFGNMYWMDAEGKTVGERRQTRFTRNGYLFGGSDLMQPATFWRKNIYLRSGGIDVSYRFTFDTDLFFRFALRGAQFRYVNKFLASFRIHPQSKSTNDEAICVAELQKLRQKYLPFPYKSLRGRCIRVGTWAYRSICYALQGDFFWLIGRIPDRIRSPWDPGIVGPRGRRV
jgi:glycosyltransferase involved in cell wall biosynthesis